MEHQRQVFDEERALWYTERTELHKKITELQRSLHRYQAVSSSVITIEDEFWRGPKPDAQPTRIFSEPTAQSTQPRNRGQLPSTTEDTTCGRKDSGDIQPEFQKRSAPGSEKDKNLDGIIFKYSTLSPLPAMKIMTPQSPSPRSTSPRTTQAPSSMLEAPSDPYIKDAGHTPPARRTYFNTDDDAASDGEDDGATPTQPKVERPPFEPHSSFVKLPSERSETYFPIAEDESQDKKDESRGGEDQSRDEDPELKGPLGLDKDYGEDKNKQFLNELDSRLQEAASSEALSTPSVGLEKDIVPHKDETDFEQPEDEPKLRMKQSMNFGSPYGAKSIGKGI